jgi:MOSC domain-containing protein YiiM
VAQEQEMTMAVPISAKILKISISSTLGQKKTNIPGAVLEAGKGIKGDIHSETGRPLSLLPFESFSKLSHPSLNLKPGDFAENITTAGLDFAAIHLGSRLLLGESVEIEIIQIGKECHFGCAIRDYAGDCIMPREGAFARVLRGGELNDGDPIRIIN